VTTAPTCKKLPPEGMIAAGGFRSLSRNMAGDDVAGIINHINQIVGIADCKGMPSTRGLHLAAVRNNLIPNKPNKLKGTLAG
jgi:hypothetical protein